MTIGRRISPCSNATRTSSLTSGMNTAPAFGPAPSWVTRAQSDSSLSDNHGNLTLTRPIFPSLSSFWVTMPGTTPMIGVLPAILSTCEQAEERTVPAAADSEVGPVAVGVKDVASVGQRVAADELL